MKRNNSASTSKFFVGEHSSIKVNTQNILHNMKIRPVSNYIWTQNYLNQKIMYLFVNMLLYI